MISAVEKSPDTPIWDEGQVEQIRQAFLDALHADGLTVAAAAKLAGIAEGTLSLWKGRSYAGRNDKIADKVSRWLDFRQDKQLRARELIAEPPFQRTKSAEQLLTIMTPEELREKAGLPALEKQPADVVGPNPQPDEQ